MTIQIGKTYFHTERKIRVVVYDLYFDGRFVVYDEKKEGEPFVAQSEDLLPIQNWTAEEILRNEG